MSPYEEAEVRPDKPNPNSFKKRLPVILGTLLIGAAGGWAFSLLNLPLAWMLGAMVSTTALAVLGVRLEGPGKGRSLVITVLGVMLGSAFTPDVFTHALRWIPSILAVVLFVALVTVSLSWGFQRFAGMRRREAILSAAPGGFGEMVLIAESYNADVRSISLIHATRIMFTVLLIPFYFRVFEGYVPPTVSPMGTIAGLGIKDAAILLGCAVSGYWIARRLGIPAAAMMGPMAISATVHFMGLTSAKPPAELVNLAQVVIGTSVGCRFVGVERRQLINPVGIGVIGAIFTLALALGAATLLEHLAHLNHLALWIAFAPGGLAEMTLISLSMNIDTAFVITHHLVRVLFIVITMGFFSRLILGKLPKE